MQLTGIIHTGSKDGKARSSPSPSVRFSIAERRTFSAPHIDLHEPLRNQGGIFSPSSRSNNSSLFSFSPLRTQSPTSAQDSRPWLARVDSKHVQSTKHTVGDSLHRSSTSSSSSYSSPSSFKAKSTTPKSTTPSRTRSKSPSFRASITAATPTTPTTSTAATPATLGRPATPSSTNIITATPPSPFVTTTTATTSSSIIITTTPPAKKSTTTSPGRSRRKQRDSSQPDVVKLIQNLRCPIGKFNTHFNNSSNNNDDNAKEHSNEEETSLSTNHNNNNNSNTRGRSESPSYSSRPQSRLSSRPESRQSTMRFVNEIVEIAEESTRTIPKVNEDEEEIFSPQELRLPPAERLQIVEEKIRQYKEQGMYDKIIQLRVHAMALMRLVYGDDSADLAYSFFDIGVNYMNMRAYEQALPHLTKALSTFSNVNYVPSKQQQQQQQPYQQQQQDVDTDTGYHLQQQQRAPSRPSSAARSRPASAMSHHSSTSAPMMMMMGNNNNNKKDHQTTTTATKQLLPQVLLMLGICYMQLKMYKKAHVVLKEAVTQSEMIFGRSHASCFPSCCALAKYYSLTKNHKLALEYLRKAWEVKEAETGSVHADIAELYKEMSMIHKMDNQLTEATEMMRRAKEVYVQLHGLSSIEAGDTAFSIGELLFESGNPEEARKEFVFAAEAFREQYGENDERTVCIDKQIALMDVDAMLKKQEQKKQKQKQNQKQNKQPERKPSEDEYGGNNNNNNDDDDYDLDQDEDEDPRGSDNAHDHHHHHHRHHPHRRMDDDNDDDDDDAGDLKQRFEAGIELLQDVLQRECDIYGEVHEAVAVSYEALADAYEFKKDFSNASLLFEKSIGIYERLSYEQQKKKYARKIRQLSKRLEHVESLAMEQEFSTRAPG